MNKREKNIVLLALVSNIRYIYNLNKKLHIYSIDNNNVNEIKALYFKLINSYFKNNPETKNYYIKYFNTITHEITLDILKNKSGGMKKWLYIILAV